MNQIITADAIRELIQDYFDEEGADYICLVAHEQCERLLVGIHNNSSLAVIKRDDSEALRRFYIDHVEITVARKEVIYPRYCSELMGGAIDLQASMHHLDENVEAWAEKLTEAYAQAKAALGAIL
jgi:hypothetical protein